MRIAFAVLIGALVAGCGSPAHCDFQTPCPADQKCIRGGLCATKCMNDSDCGLGRSCQITSADCAGTGCSAASAEVCLDSNGKP